MNDDLISRSALIAGRVSNDPVVIAATCAPAVYPIHAAGGCYCRECRFWIDDDAENPKRYCARLSDDNYTVYTDQDEFCSRGDKQSWLSPQGRHEK